MNIIVENKTSTGPWTEAVRLARVRTGRSKVLVITDPNGLESLDQDVERVPYGQTAALCATIAECTNERVAAIVVEPTLDVFPRHRWFLKKVRELASAEGALLICDEAVCARFGVRVDLAYGIAG